METKTYLWLAIVAVAPLTATFFLIKVWREARKLKKEIHQKENPRKTRV